ncbi:Transposase-associated domain protein [Raphanus sativus]|nr:Transposase-associated domain protein [Raphanus sativus]
MTIRVSIVPSFILVSFDLWPGLSLMESSQSAQVLVFITQVFAFKERRLRKQAIETYINHHLPQKVVMDKSWIYKPRLSEAYTDGVDAFLEFAFGNIQVEKLKCSCNRCSLYTPRTRIEIRDHLICYGFMKSYTNWVLHGEEIELPEINNQRGGEIHTDPISRDESMTHLLNDLFPNITNHSTNGEVPPVDVDEPVNNNTYEPLIME